MSSEIQQNKFCTYFILLAPPTFIVFAVFVRVERALAIFCNHLRLFGGFCSKGKLIGSNFVILFASFNLVNFPLLIAKAPIVCSDLYKRDISTLCCSLQKDEDLLHFCATVSSELQQNNFVLIF